MDVDEESPVNRVDDLNEATSEVSSDVSFRPFVSDGDSETSYNVSMRSPSPARSVLSMTSSMRAQAFIQEYGRGYNNYSEVYRLPADEEELERLHKQHMLLRQVVGKYPPVLAEVLADDVPGETKTVLDLGCGSGGWIMEVANDFPNCSAVAVDLIPLQSLSMPPNCRSEVDDINLGLEHYYGDFNVVHARLVSAGIKDYHGLIDHISKVLRPGGLMCLGEFAFDAFDINKESYQIDDMDAMEPPWVARWVRFMTMAFEKRGANTDAANHMVQWVTEHGSFEHIVAQEYFIPMSPWVQGDDPEAVRLRSLGEFGREDLAAFLKSTKPLLLGGSGLPSAVVEELYKNAINELMEAKVPIHSRVQAVYAMKKHPATNPATNPPPTQVPNMDKT